MKFSIMLTKIVYKDYVGHAHTLIRFKHNKQLNIFSCAVVKNRNSYFSESLRWHENQKVNHEMATNKNVNQHFCFQMLSILLKHFY